MFSVTPDLTVHVDLIDREHAELFKHINAVYELKDHRGSMDEAAQVIQYLGDYIVTHFTHEEELQLKSGYPKIEWHKGLHRTYRTSFEILKKEYEKFGYSEAFAQTLNMSIANWIVKHIKYVDVEMGKFMNGEINL
ncbi:MAG: hemerythrin family protein [Firmicutes bacterium]|nr:hemerythrin family protein [Bacillota bacterium]